MRIIDNKPANLDETIVELTKIFDEQNIWHLLKEDENTFIGKIHHAGGMWIRNNWGLWEQKGKLYEQLAALGFTHADDMSSVILRNFYRTKNNLEPLDLDAEAKYYKDYWEESEKAYATYKPSMVIEIKKRD